MNSETDTRWYREGLHFGCTECGKCCSGSLGYVWVSLDEIRALAAVAGLTLDEFGQRFLRRAGSRYALLESVAGDCILLRDGLCTLYQARPVQCRSFPFWTSLLGSSETWRRAAQSCEGIREAAPLIEYKEIERRRCDPGRGGHEARNGRT